MPAQNEARAVAAYARSCLAADRWDRDWFRAAVTSLEAAGERIVKTEEPAAGGSEWTVLDWRTGEVLATIRGGQGDVEAAWQAGWTDVAWIGRWLEDFASGGETGPDWPEILPLPPPAPDPPGPLALSLPGSLADRLEETIETWASEASIIPDRTAAVADLTGWTIGAVLACTASWLAVPGDEYMRLGEGTA
jgi:hypothetical protein